MNIKSTSTSKKVNPVKEFVKVAFEVITVIAIGIAIGVYAIAADMKEHPSISGIDPNKSVAEIIVEDVLSA